MDEKLRRAPKVSNEQKIIMVNFIEDNTKMITGKLIIAFSDGDSRKFWASLEMLLNSCNGAKKKTGRKLYPLIQHVVNSISHLSY